MAQYLPIGVSPDVHLLTGSIAMQQHSWPFRVQVLAHESMLALVSLEKTRLMPVAVRSKFAPPVKPIVSAVVSTFADNASTRGRQVTDMFET